LLHSVTKSEVKIGEKTLFRFALKRHKKIGNHTKQKKVLEAKQNKKR
jgi:hypothetical protein